MPAALSRRRLTVRSGPRLGRDFQPVSYARASDGLSDPLGSHLCPAERGGRHGSAFSSDALVTSSRPNSFGTPSGSTCAVHSAIGMWRSSEKQSRGELASGGATTRAQGVQSTGSAQPCPSAQRLTTRLISSAISSHAEPFASSEPKRQTSGRSPPPDRSMCSHSAAPL
jgi:hypothetical protein